MHLGLKAQTLEYGRGAGLRSVAVESLDRLLELVEAFGVEALLGPGEERLLLDHRVPKLGVAHERDLQHLLVLVQELVLAQDAEPEALRDRDRSFAGLHVPAQDVEEGCLPAAVRAHEPITLPGIQLEGGPGEKRSVAIGFGEVGHGYHGRGI